jgi:tRNA-splicing ligase RtcB
MRVPGRFFADKRLLEDMEDMVLTQVRNVASLPGIVTASLAMPDAHSGYGFPIGGVAAFDPDEGVVSAGGVGFDISCGVRTLLTNLDAAEVAPRAEELADALFSRIPAGVGSTGGIRLKSGELDAISPAGVLPGRSPGDSARKATWSTSRRARPHGGSPARHGFRHGEKRQQDQVGTLGPATTTWKFKWWMRFSTTRPRRSTAFPPAKCWSASIAAPGGSGTRSPRTIWNACANTPPATA